LNLHPYMMPSANLSENYTNPDNISRPACHYCGFCERFGCEYAAKADPLNTVIPVALNTGNFELRMHANVVEILHQDGKAVGVKYIDTITREEYIQPVEVVGITSYA